MESFWVTTPNPTLLQSQSALHFAETSGATTAEKEAEVTLKTNKPPKDGEEC